MPGPNIARFIQSEGDPDVEPTPIPVAAPLYGGNPLYGGGGTIFPAGGALSNPNANPNLTKGEIAKLNKGGNLGNYQPTGNLYQPYSPYNQGGPVPFGAAPLPPANYNPYSPPPSTSTVDPTGRVIVRGYGIPGQPYIGPSGVYGYGPSGVPMGIPGSSDIGSNIPGFDAGGIETPGTSALGGLDPGSGARGIGETQGSLRGVRAGYIPPAYAPLHYSSGAPFNPATYSLPLGTSRKYGGSPYGGALLPKPGGRGPTLL